MDIAKGIRKLDKPRSIQVGFVKAEDTTLTLINVVYADGQVFSYPISRPVAEALIASGISYEG